MPPRFVLLAWVVCLGFTSAGRPALEKTGEGIIVPVAGRFLKIQVCADDIVRIACSGDRRFFARTGPALVPPREPQASWTLAQDKSSATVSTSKLKVRVDLASGDVSFYDAGGRRILAETTGGRTFTPAEVQGEATQHVRQEWAPNEDESLYGLGQQQFGLMDLKGRDLDLWQRNTVVALPVLVSSRGYGILWDNTSRTRFGDLRDPEPIPPAQLRDAAGKPGALTATYFGDAARRAH